MLLPISAEWKNIGTLMYISQHVLQEIDANQQKVTDCLREMLSKWINQVKPRPTWSILAEAVEDFDPSIATKIRETCKLFLTYTIITYIKLELDLKCLCTIIHVGHPESVLSLQCFQYVGRLQRTDSG